MSDARQRRGKGAGRGAEARNAAEWTSLVVSLGILMVLVALVSYPVVTGQNRPPTIEVTPVIEELRREPSGFYLPVEVVNRGDRTAEELRLRFTLPTAQGAAETAELVIAFLAGGERTQGTVVFRSDPSAGGLRAEVVSYLDP